MKKFNVFIAAILLILSVMALAACKDGTLSIVFEVDGVEYHTAELGKDMGFSLPADPQKNGYVFDGWYLENGTKLTEESITEILSSGEIKVYARWVPVTETPTLPVIWNNKKALFNEIWDGIFSADMFEVVGGSVAAELREKEFLAEFDYVIKDNFNNIFAAYMQSGLSEEDIDSLNTLLGEGAYYSYIKLSDNLAVIDTIYSLGKILTADIQVNGDLYILDGELLRYKGSETAYTVPEGITQIGYGAFIRNSGLTTVVLNDKVTHLGDAAFEGCSQLSNINFEEAVNLEYIGNRSFYSVGSLTSLYVPAKVKTIGHYAFDQCAGIASIEFAEGIALESIGIAAFRSAVIAEVTVPASVKNLGGFAFTWCQNLERVVFEENSALETIGDEAFAWCEKLTDIVLPASVTKIGAYAFYECKSLPSIAVPEGVKKLEQFAFAFCDVLKDITLPSDLEEIGHRAFDGCFALTEISLPAGLKKIDTKAFSQCRGLAAISLPEGLEELGLGAFEWCWALASVSVAHDNGHFKVTDGVLYTIDGKKIVFCPPALPAENLTISASVETVGARAFSSCSNLKTITFGDDSSLTAIEDWAFEECRNITEINLGTNSKLEKIGEHAFYNCARLTAFTIPETVTEIGVFVFQECSRLESANIPSSFTVIPEGMFSGCRKLNGFVLPEGAVEIGGWAFSDCRSLGELFIPKGVKKIGDQAFVNTFALDITFEKDSELESIGEYAFYSSTGITSVSLPASVKEIKREAFSLCSNLTSLHLAAATPPSLGDAPFTDVPEGFKIYVPEESLSAYLASESWANFADILVGE